MNREEAKAILLLYRPGTADAEDPQIAEALAAARQDDELSRWLEKHCNQQAALRGKFQQINAPAGLKEQIISEQPSREKLVSLWRREIRLTPVAAMAVALLFAGLLATFWFANHHRRSDDTLADYQNQMAAFAQRGYGMDVTTNDLVPIRAYFAQNHAPADFVLPEKLKQANLVGCAIEGWQDVKVSLICFRSSHAAPNVSNDTWLFVVDRTAVKKTSAGPVPQISTVNGLTTATWIQGSKLYFLGTTGDVKAIQQYL